jgi:hypothetical protein
VYSSYACYVRNGDLVWRDPYDAAIALMKLVYIEDSFAGEGMVTKDEVGISRVPRAW